MPLWFTLFYSASLKEDVWPEWQQDRVPGIGELHTGVRFFSILHSWLCPLAREEIKCEVGLYENWSLQREELLTARPFAQGLRTSWVALLSPHSESNAQKDKPVFCHLHCWALLRIRDGEKEIAPNWPMRLGDWKLQEVKPSALKTLKPTRL